MGVIALTSAPIALASTTAQAASGLVEIGATIPIPAGAKAIGALAPTTAIRVAVSMKPHNAAALESLIHALYTKNSPDYHHFLTKGHYATEFGPSKNAISTVEDALRASGLSITGVEGNGLIISAKGTAADAANVFHVAFERYRLKTGATGFAATGRPSLQPSVASVASGVIGLSNLEKRHPQLIRHSLHKAAGSSTHQAPRATPTVSVNAVNACSSLKSVAATWSSYTWTQIAAAYGFTSQYEKGNEGAGTSVGLFELALYPRTNVTKFARCYGLSTLDITNVPVHGGATQATGGQVETTLDIQDILGFAPKTHLYVYSAKNTTATSIAEYAQMVSDDAVQVISTSWGLCEHYTTTTTLEAEYEVFGEAALQGQSIFAASGDTGSADCALRGTPTYGLPTMRAVDDPASQPFVTGVGGTSLQTATPSIHTETVWNNFTVPITPTTPTLGYIGGGGGGGVSTIWEKPTWQTTGRPAGTVPQPTVPTTFTATPLPLTATGDCTVAAGTADTTTSCRQVPDVAATADPTHGDMVYCLRTGTCTTTIVATLFPTGWVPFGGTSAAAPLWAAATAIADEANGSAVGFLNPYLYTVGTSTDVFDVTTGTNNARGDTFLTVFGAGVGYDNASGWGTPDMHTLATSIASVVGAVSDFTITPATPGAGTVTTTYHLKFTTHTTLLAEEAVTVGASTATFFNTTPGSITISVTGVEKTSFVAITSAVNVLSFYLGTNIPVGAKVTVTLGKMKNHDAPGSYTLWMRTQTDSATVRASYSLITSTGYQMVGADGGVFSFQPTGILSHFDGSLPGLHISVSNIVGMVDSSDHLGYYLVGADGGVFAFGDTTFVGSLPGIGVVPVAPIVGIVPTPDDLGYFLVGRDGGVFAFGDATFAGSLPGIGVHRSDVIGIAATSAGTGYWVVTSNGSVYAFGTAHVYGSANGTTSPVTAIAPSADGLGYYLVEADGGIIPFGDATVYGTLPNLGVAPSFPVSGLVLTKDARGYWMIGADGGIFAFGDAPFLGSLPGLGVHIADVVGAVQTR